MARYKVRYHHYHNKNGTVEVEVVDSIKEAEEIENMTSAEHEYYSYYSNSEHKYVSVTDSEVRDENGEIYQV